MIGHEAKVFSTGSCSEFDVSFSTTAAESVYLRGLYRAFAGNSDFTTPVTFGNANEAHRAHLALVLGAAAVDNITIAITGPSISDSGVRTASDSENIVIPSGTAANAYFETAKHWLDTITITHISGTAKVCNYLFSEYWDNSDADFFVESIDCQWRAGATDTGANIEVLHHKSTGWVYGAGGPTIPAAVFSMVADMTPDTKLIADRNGRWERSGMDYHVLGANKEGIFVRVTSGAPNAFKNGHISIRVRS